MTNEKKLQEFRGKWYSDFNHINDIKKICSEDCEKDFTLAEVEKWNIDFLLQALQEKDREWVSKIKEAVGIEVYWSVAMGDKSKNWQDYCDGWNELRQKIIKRLNLCSPN
jgi:hypothetical protein